MQNLLFFMRVAFICNCCMLLSWAAKWLPVLPFGFAQSTLFIMGTAMAIFLNLLVNLALFFLLMRKKSALRYFPGWLIIANFLFLTPQLLLLFQ